MDAKALIIAIALAGTSLASAQTPAARPRDPSQSPAARPRPKVSTAPTYAAAEVNNGERRFSSDCGFCHGRDAAGGESGPDLTRSELILSDPRGDKLGPFLRVGRPEAGMPSFDMSETDVKAITAFVHTQIAKFTELGGGRRTVDPADLTTGNAADGRAYFNGAGGCSACHSPTGDLKNIATRFQGLALLQRMLYPAGQPAPAPAKAIFTVTTGQTITAPLVFEDEFSVTVLDPLGARQTYPKDKVKVKIDDPMSAHFVQLGKYSDAAMHNVLAYLQTLK